eukprot:gnl/TRDRNA2_/TRDRNA2_92835_c0_seq3.p1 gnl/TRDRNA2_/TRDRNA2_92835_c0~~gnl/TRDRNA2_/TRDRNA2_92835_c0_seq3.p1  ORF type:complete len:238 (+),score=20.53 gnl/TRDRNA2_/TRDRNA2_92835_c0_seq3:100-813(+)
MLITLVALSGREISTIELDPSVTVRDLYRQVRELVVFEHTCSLVCRGTRLSADSLAAIKDTCADESCLLTLVVHAPPSLLTASFDHTAKIWSADSGECRCTLTGHRSFVLSAVFSADNEFVLTASWDHTAKLWSSDSGECLCTFEGHTDSVFSVEFSGDGDWALTASKALAPAGRRVRPHLRRACRLSLVCDLLCRQHLGSYCFVGLYRQSMECREWRLHWNSGRPCPLRTFCHLLC